MGNNNPKYWESIILSSITDEDIPSTYVILNNGKFVGTFSIWACDLMSGQDLYPWLAGIVVKEEYRNQGVGTFILEYSLNILKNLSKL